MVHLEDIEMAELAPDSAPPATSFPGIFAHNSVANPFFAPQMTATTTTKHFIDSDEEEAEECRQRKKARLEAERVAVRDARRKAVGARRRVAKAEKRGPVTAIFSDAKSLVGYQCGSQLKSGPTTATTVATPEATKQAPGEFKFTFLGVGRRN